VTCPGVWSQLQATVGQTSPGPWLGWTVLPRQVWYATDTTVSRKRGHVTTEGDRAAHQTVAEGSHISQGSREGTKGCSTEEKEGQSAGI